MKRVQQSSIEADTRQDDVWSEKHVKLVKK